MTRHLYSCAVACSLVIHVASTSLGAEGATEAKPIPAEIQAIFDKPLYKNASWGLRVVDLETGKVVYDLRPDQKFRIGSVRKLFSVGLALDKLGTYHKFETPIYRTGEVKNGVLTGDLVLVASGDLSMGGRKSLPGWLAITNYDHNEANALGNAELATRHPLAGYRELAEQVAQTGIKEVKGDIVIDDRLFVPFNFRSEFDVRPIFVNDDVVDVIVDKPGRRKMPAVDWQPESAAFTVKSSWEWGPNGSATKIKFEPECPNCFGKANCQGTVDVILSYDWVPPLTKGYPVIRTFRITEPQNYARTVLIEALEKAGVHVSASAVGRNDEEKLPGRDSYKVESRVAELESVPYSQYARWILKVSYNIGADTSLVLFGLSQGVNSLPDSLVAEKKTLATEFGIEPETYEFFDGSGGGESAATPAVVVSFLRSMKAKPYFDTFRFCLPILAIDGSLVFVTDFATDRSLAGAKGKVQAKTGTYLSGNSDGKLSLRSQSLAGYIDTKSGRHLAYALFVNDVSPVTGLEDVLQAFQDEGTISAIIWREN